MNRKALDQYAGFADQRNTLVQRQQEMARSEASIRTCIQTLDMRKDAAIEQTFKVTIALLPLAASTVFMIFSKNMTPGRGRSE